MLQIKCPWCGIRDETEFQYRGDATAVRPDENASIDELFRFAYVRKNPKGWHTEWWLHVRGCRQFIKVVRNTLNHEIAATGWPQDHLEIPSK